MATELKITNFVFRPLSDEGVDEELDDDNDLGDEDNDNEESEDGEDGESSGLVEE